MITILDTLKAPNALAMIVADEFNSWPEGRRLACGFSLLSPLEAQQILDGKRDFDTSILKKYCSLVPDTVNYQEIIAIAKDVCQVIAVLDNDVCPIINNM